MIRREGPRHRGCRLHRQHRRQRLPGRGPVPGRRSTTSARAGGSSPPVAQLRGNDHGRRAPRQDLRRACRHGGGRALCRPHRGARVGGPPRRATTTTTSSARCGWRSTSRRVGARRLLFSSSASIYASPEGGSAVDESALSPVEPVRPVEGDGGADPAPTSPPQAGLRVLSLRYFNPIGADPLLRTGLQHRLPTHALGRLITAHESGTPFTVAGTDWPTRDGSAIRDFVHVWDLARAHVAALPRFDAALEGQRSGRSTSARAAGRPSGNWWRRSGRRGGRAEGARGAAAAGGRRGRLRPLRRRASGSSDGRAERSVVDGVRDALAWSARRPAVLGA